MCAFRKSFLVGLVVTALAVSLAGAPTSGTFTGRVRDIDFGKSSTQVIISGTAPIDDLVATVADSRLQALLEAALVGRYTATVTYTNHVITTVELIGHASGCVGDGCVQELKCTHSSCTARISGQSGAVNTSNSRALGILLTAIENHSAVSYLSTDKSGNILRVKINVQ